MSILFYAFEDPFKKVVLLLYSTAVKEPVLWAGVSDQWLSTTLDQNVALLIGLWQYIELGASKKHLMYIILSSFRKLHHSFSS